MRNIIAWAQQEMAGIRQSFGTALGCAIVWTGAAVIAFMVTQGVHSAVEIYNFFSRPSGPAIEGDIVVSSEQQTIAAGGGLKFRTEITWIRDDCPGSHVISLVPSDPDDYEVVLGFGPSPFIATSMLLDTRMSLPPGTYHVVLTLRFQCWDGFQRHTSTLNRSSMVEVVAP